MRSRRRTQPGARGESERRAVQLVCFRRTNQQRAGGQIDSAQRLFQTKQSGCNTFYANVWKRRGCCAALPGASNVPREPSSFRRPCRFGSRQDAGRRKTSLFQKRQRGGRSNLLSGCALYPPCLPVRNKFLWSASKRLPMPKERESV